MIAISKKNSLLILTKYIKQKQEIPQQNIIVWKSLKYDSIQIFSNLYFLNIVLKSKYFPDTFLSRHYRVVDNN